jgi:hypothetical protein
MPEKIIEYAEYWIWLLEKLFKKKENDMEEEEGRLKIYAAQ